MTDVVEIGARAIRIALNRGVHFRDDTGEVAIRAALAALNEAGYVVERGWQPIETAPKDETLIDVWVGGEFPGRRTDVSWREPTGREWWMHGGETLKNPAKAWFDSFGPLGNLQPPTHWMPIPQCPR